jgi:hypothetical protein
MQQQGLVNAAYLFQELEKHHQTLPESGSLLELQARQLGLQEAILVALTVGTSLSWKHLIENL